jgi:hypothetical protein
MKRFGLKAMLLVVTVLGLFLGYNQSRRRDILRECKPLRDLGARILVPSDFVDYFWQRRPKSAEIHFTAQKWGASSIMVTTHGIEEMHRRLREMGIDVDEIRHFSDIAGDKPADKPTIVPQQRYDGIDWSLPNAREKEQEKVKKLLMQKSTARRLAKP